MLTRPPFPGLGSAPAGTLGRDRPEPDPLEESPDPLVVLPGPLAVWPGPLAAWPDPLAAWPDPLAVCRIRWRSGRIRWRCRRIRWRVHRSGISRRDVFGSFVCRRWLRRRLRSCLFLTVGRSFLDRCMVPPPDSHFADARRCEVLGLFVGWWLAHLGAGGVFWFIVSGSRVEQGQAATVVYDFQVVGAGGKAARQLYTSTM